MANNIHGLSRHIPEEIKLEVRRRSKFGCVHCRLAICVYEHIAPPFNEASEHDSDCICLLCGRCHDLVTRGYLSKETILSDYNEIQHATDVEKPKGSFDLADRNWKIRLGNGMFEDAESLISIDGRNILSISKPEEGSVYHTLSGIFTDQNGEEIFQIHKNVWEGPISHWDLDARAGSISVRNAPNRIALQIDVKPPDTLEVVNLDMIYSGCHLIFTPEKMTIGSLHSGKSYYVSFGGYSCKGASVGISVDTRSIVNPELTHVEIKGGEGIFLHGIGIAVGIDAPIMHIKDFKIYEI